MAAIEELPEKDKDLILPIFLLRGWVNSNKLENSIKRIHKSIGKNRPWIADIDETFLIDKDGYPIALPHPRPIYAELAELLLPARGYRNWFRFLQVTENAIPVVQLGDITQLSVQIDLLSSLNRGIVLRLSIEHLDPAQKEHLEVIIGVIESKRPANLFVILDYKKLTREVLSATNVISSHVAMISARLSPALISISGSSFPEGFSKEHEGENPIYERLLFNAVRKNCSDIQMIYSDRGSARVEKLGGGSGTPAPRIDYPLDNDWRFVREELNDSYTIDEKNYLYTIISQQLMLKDYWDKNLHIWGTQVIEYTSRGEDLGITSPVRATAVRINLHLHRQLCYESHEDLIDTEEAWID